MTDQTRLVCGLHATKAALVANRLLGIKIVQGSNRNLVRTVERRGIKIEIVSESHLTQLSGTSKHQKVVAICAPLNEIGWRVAIRGVKNPLLLVLDQVQDPRNLGACLRTAGALGVQALIHPKRRSASLTPTARKVAEGAEEIVVVDAVVNIARELEAMQQLGLRVIGTDLAAGVDIKTLEEQGPVALVLGGEEKGMRELTRKQCDVLVHIPMLGAQHVASLNVSVACGICVEQLMRSRQ